MHSIASIRATGRPVDQTFFVKLEKKICRQERVLGILAKAFVVNSTSLPLRAPSPASSSRRSNGR
jgi:hypothetical protein